jgi:hypothetical protein
MVKTPPEKLAAALRANLKRRKSALAAKPLSGPAKDPGAPVKKAKAPPSGKD